MDCFGTYLTHAQSCDNVRVHSATQWTASVHTLRMPKAVITFMFKVLRNGLLAYIPTHAQICDNVRVHNTTEWIVFSPFSRFRRFRVFAFSFFPVSVLGVFAFSRFRVFVFRRRHPGGRDTDFVCTDGGVRVFVSIVGPLRFITFRGGCLTLVLLG